MAKRSHEGRPGKGRRWLASVLTKVAPDWAEMLAGDLLHANMARRVERMSSAQDDPHEIAHLGSGIVVLDSHYCLPGTCRMEAIELLHTKDGRAMLMPNDPFWEDIKRDHSLEPAKR